MKIKCPFCKQDYDFSEDEILNFLKRHLQCAKCENIFSLLEVIPAFDTYIALIKTQKELEKAKRELKDAREHYRSFKKDSSYDYMDEARFAKYDAQNYLDDCKLDYEDLSSECKRLKEVYAFEKKTASEKELNKEKYAITIIKLIEDGILLTAPKIIDRERIFRISKKANLNISELLLWLYQNCLYLFPEQLKKIYHIITDNCDLPIPKLDTFEDKGSITEKQYNYLIDLGFPSSEAIQLSVENASKYITLILDKNKDREEFWLKSLKNIKDIGKLNDFLTFFNTNVKLDTYQKDRYKNYPRHAKFIEREKKKSLQE